MPWKMLDGMNSARNIMLAGYIPPHPYYISMFTDGICFFPILVAPNIMMVGLL